MKIVIIKYNAGNIQSVSFALERLGYQAEITADHDAIRNADKVIFPGVGEASTTMAYLKSEGLDQLIPSLKQPVLGICLGMQLMCSHSEEGDTPCLGIFDEKVKKFIAPPKDSGNIKIPHMGWNQLTNVREPLFNKELENEYVYFVHSFYVATGPDTAAESNYIHPFSAALRKDNFYATQFHPEKSSKAGEQILRNFLEM
ncbi:imidazole glycerol phosphate synthase subunit HisH [Marinilabilia salmonicolor]|jgi:glutamine amidotransferase|uniref:Imidazole glycerol phosphate synthase subunit HisH n=1 Tax=Marinilabilia salmonicolor TaxID=989 RepID=A0A2T0XT65_9BACT|nr:imidazole glycerol phosphate synthase subunit HisH [Marinilabilia salmonicolor]PRZ02144.1 imidazole glycerol phosphate synthase subunit HisH [Marinilabilia salmonicolor]RCW36099.1 imidazole glycerol phosphate synthase subunit HisH [Marinilabilia salmonicolor]